MQINCTFNFLMIHHNTATLNDSYTKQRSCTPTVAAMAYKIIHTHAPRLMPCRMLKKKTNAPPSRHFVQQSTPKGLICRANKAKYAHIAGIAQLVEQRIRNAKVVGSTPITGTI